MNFQSTNLLDELFEKESSLNLHFAYLKKPQNLLFIKVQNLLFGIKVQNLLSLKSSKFAVFKKLKI